MIINNCRGIPDPAHDDRGSQNKSVLKMKFGRWKGFALAASVVAVLLLSFADLHSGIVTDEMSSALSGPQKLSETLDIVKERTYFDR